MGARKPKILDTGLRRHDDISFFLTIGLIHQRDPPDRPQKQKVRWIPVFTHSR
jgi:hypothetical protein